jgi:hypothetical protein
MAQSMQTEATTQQTAGLEEHTPRKSAMGCRFTLLRARNGRKAIMARLAEDFHNLADRTELRANGEVPAGGW